MSIIECVISNVAIATALALLAALVGRVTTKPQIAHTLWVLVLVKLVTPPVVHIPVGYPVSTTVALESSGDSAKNAMSELLSASNDEPIERDEELGAHAVRSMEVPGFPFVPNQGADTNSSISTFALHVSWTKALVGVWVAGALLWFLLATTRLLRFRNVLQCAHPASEEMKAEVSMIASRYGLRDIPQVLIADAKVPPLIWGLGGRASMILPSVLLKKLGPDERAALIAHELAHLKRYDHWIRWFEFVILGIYWWNPVAWWARARIQQAEEECCDAWVLWTFPDSARQYAQTLVDTVDFLAGSSERKPEIATAFNQVNSLKRRIEMIVNAKVDRRLSWKMRAVLILLALIVVPLSLLGSQSGSIDKSEATHHEKAISNDEERLAFSGDNSQPAKTRQVEPRDPASTQAAVPHSSEAADAPAVGQIPQIEKPVVGKNYVIMPITTNLQRTKGKAYAKASFFILINGQALFNEDDTVLNMSALPLHTLMETMQGYTEAGIRGDTVIQFCWPLPLPRPGDYKGASASQALKSFLEHGYILTGWPGAVSVTMRWPNRDWKYANAWESLVADLTKPVPEGAVEDEAGIGDDQVKLYAVRTPLSQHLFGMFASTNCVVHIIPPIGEAKAGAVLSMQRYLPQLKLKSKGSVRFNVRVEDSAVANAVLKDFTGKQVWKDLLGFETASTLFIN